MVAGADTTAVYLRFFVACMATYSDVQARAQQEIDSVIGSSRTPEVDDIDSLPFLKAVINEVSPCTLLADARAAHHPDICIGPSLPSNSATCHTAHKYS